MLFYVAQQFQKAVDLTEFGLFLIVYAPVFVTDLKQLEEGLVAFKYIVFILVV